MTHSTSQKERIDLIDTLRGLTLLGIILVHFTEQYYAGNPPPSSTHLNPLTLPDQLVKGLIAFFIAGKFFMIFSFLFGLSFFLQSNNTGSKGQFYARFFWRLVILFGIGWIHTLHYRGDILTIYALLGCALLALHTLPNRVILILALLLIADVPAFIVRGVEAVKSLQLATASNKNPFEGNEAGELAYYRVLKEPSYLNILKANVPEFSRKMGFQVLSGRLYITLGLFLLGLYVGRQKLFENPSIHLAAIKKARNKALWAMLLVILTAVAIFGGAQVAKINLTFPFQFLIGGLIMDLFNACLALFYVCVLILLYQQETWRNRLSLFYAAGRMGLTTYLMQTLFGFIIFFGVGFNLLDQIGAALCAALGLAVFGLQLVFANWWLKRFYYGPVEWLWRSLTYLKVQAFARTRV
jgi:uncharacterized protein